MKLSRRVLDAYNAAIKKQGDNAEDAARKALEAWFDENPDATVADAREFSIALMREVGTFYGNAAGDVAYSLRDMAAEAAGVELPPVDYEYAPEAEYVEKAGHRQAGKLVEGNRPGFVDGIAKSSRYFAERGANDTMAALGLADGKRLGKRVRFARVPTGDTTCPYCCMLASRGFVYHSELKALNANHQNCDCRIVEGFKGMEVEGYDPDLYYDMWKNPEKYENEFGELQRDEMSRHAHELEKQIQESHAPFMATDSTAIDWPQSAQRLSKDRFDKLNEEYASRGVKLHDTCSGAMADESAISEILDAAADALSKIPGLKQLGGLRPLTIVMDYEMDSREFGKIMPNKPWIIHVNAYAVRDIAKLEEEYGKLAGDGWFVKGTNARGVVHHELGHAFEKLYNIDAKRIAKEILGAKGDDELAYGLLVNLSEYSSLHVDSEITSEVMAAWLGGTDNWFAEEFMKRILEV